MFSGHFFSRLFSTPHFSEHFFGFFFAFFFNFSNFPSENFEVDAPKKITQHHTPKLAKDALRIKKDWNRCRQNPRSQAKTKERCMIFRGFFKKVAARKMRSRKAHPALFCLCNALKRFFEALSLLNWTQLSSPLRAQSRSIFPGKFSSKPHVRHSPDQAKRVNSPPLRLFRVRHCDPGGSRLISPRFSPPSLSTTFSSCPLAPAILPSKSFFLATSYSTKDENRALQQVFDKNTVLRYLL